MISKVYSFSVEDACKHGIDAAVILHNMRYWLDYARAHDEMKHDGYYWMFASASKMTSIFPFWSSNKIQKLLKKLEDSEVIISGSFSKNKFDRTKWYTMSDYSTQPNGGIRKSQTDESTFSQMADSLYDQYKDDNKYKRKPSRFTPPTQEEVFLFMQEKGYPYQNEAMKFVNFYGSKGWMVGKNKMKNWKLAVNNWLSNCGLQKQQAAPKQEPRNTLDDELRLL